MPLKRKLELANFLKILLIKSRNLKNPVNADLKFEGDGVRSEHTLKLSKQILFGGVIDSKKIYD